MGNWGMNYSSEPHRPIFYAFLIVLVIWICVRSIFFWNAHARNIYAPLLQRCCMRLGMSFALYSIFLLLICLIPSQSLGFSIALYFLEGYIVYTFFALMIFWAGGRRRIKEFLHSIYTGSPLKIVTQPRGYTPSPPSSTTNNDINNSSNDNDMNNNGSKSQGQSGEGHGSLNVFHHRDNYCLQLEKSFCPQTFCFWPNVEGYFTMLECFVIQMMFLKSIESIILLTLDEKDDLEQFQKVDKVCRFLGVFSLVLAYTCVIRLVLIIYPHMVSIRVKEQFCWLKVLVLLLTFQGTLLSLIYTSKANKEGQGVDGYVSGQQNAAAVASVIGIIEIAVCIDRICRLFSYKIFEDVALGTRQLEMPIKYISSSKESFNTIEEGIYQVCLWNIWNEDNESIERFHLDSFYQGGQNENLISPLTVNSTNAA